MDAAKQWLREKGLAASAKRDDRDNTQGVVALLVDGNVGAIVELKCETDFVAGSEQFKAEAETLATLVAAKGEDARRASAQASSTTSRSRSRRRSSSVRSCASRPPPGNVLDSYLHVQGGRGVNGVLVEMAGGVARAGPRHRRAHRLRPAEVPAAATTCPADVVDAERETLETITPQRGQARGGAAEDRRGSPQRLLQGRRPARAAVRQGRQAVDQAAARRRATIVRFAQVEIG